MRRQADALGPAAIRTASLRNGLDFVRISAMGATLLIGMLGAAAVPGGAAAPAAFVAVAVVSAIFHTFAYVLNDIVDLELDRTEPRRAEMPLVTGAVTTTTAWLVVVACVPLALGATVLASPPSGVLPASVCLGVAFACLATYDLIGKRTRWPPATDLIQGIGWAALLLSAAWTSGGVTLLTAALAAYVTVFIVMANGVHGSLRDLQNDQLHGVVTTATLLGARVEPDGRRIIPRALFTYAWALQVVLLAIVAVALAVDDAPVAGRVAATAATVLLSMASVLLLVAAQRRAGPSGDQLRGLGGADGDLLAAGMLHLLVGLAIPVALVSARTPLPLIGVMLAAYLVPVLAHGWLAGAGQWLAGAVTAALRQLGRMLLDLVVLTRPHNALAAGLAAAVGAHLGGVDPLLAEPVLRVALVPFLVVAAANVSNDLLDVAEDSINYPDRAIASGRIAPRTAGVFATGLAAGGIALAFTFGVASGVAVALLAAASLAYSAWLKRTVFVGNALVAALAGATFLYGGLTLGQPTLALAIGSGFAMLSVFASEVLISVLDRDGDAAAGRRTIGTRLSIAAGLRLHRILLLTLMALVVVPPLMGAVPIAFLPAALLGVVVPNVLVLVRIRDAHLARDLLRAYPISKIAWFTGMAALLFLA